MPLSLNKAGGKLSKRHGDVAVEDFVKKGYLKEALINFSALQGWSPYGRQLDTKTAGHQDKGNEEIFSLDEFLNRFKVEDMGIAPGVFDTDKLDFLNGYYIRQKSLEELLGLCKPYLEENINLATDSSKGEDEFLLKVIKTVQERLKVLSEVTEFTKFYFENEPLKDHSLLAWKKMDQAQAESNLKTLVSFLKGIKENDWKETKLEELIIKFIKDNDFKIGEYLWPMRVALTGLKASPGPFEVANVLGKDESIARIERLFV